MQIEWWYWIIFGIGLIGLELLFVPSFTIIWFGLGALAVGLCLAVRPGFPIAGQAILWVVASISFTLMWYKYLKPKGYRFQSESSRKVIVGSSGIIVRGADRSCDRWTVKLGTPALGADEWCCYSDEVLQVGDAVRVVDIEGQILKVDKIRTYNLKNKNQHLFRMK